MNKQIELPFVGDDFDQHLDGARLTGQVCRIYRLMKDAKWRTLQEIQEGTGDPQASISAQLRHLRKVSFGGHTVEKQRRVDDETVEECGLWEYQLQINPFCKVEYEEVEK